MPPHSTYIQKPHTIRCAVKTKTLHSLFRGEGSRNDVLTFYKVNLSSGPKIPKEKFDLELIFTMKKVRSKGEGFPKKSGKFHSFNFDGMP